WCSDASSKFWKKTNSLKRRIRTGSLERHRRRPMWKRSGAQSSAASPPSFRNYPFCDCAGCDWRRCSEDKPIRWSFCSARIRLSSHFLTNAEQKFHDRPFMHFQTLDLDKPPPEQGLAEHSFDVILASHVLHATPDLRRSLGHIRQLLAPGGFLVLVEFDRAER